MIRDPCRKECLLTNVYVYVKYWSYVIVKRFDMLFQTYVFVQNDLIVDEMMFTKGIS